MRTTIAVVSKKNKSALASGIDVFGKGSVGQPLEYTIVSLEKMVSHKNPEVISKQNINTSTIIGCSCTKEAKKKYNFLQLKDAGVVFEGQSYTPIDKEKLVREITKNFPNCETQMQVVIEKIEGDYALFMIHREGLVVVRDPIGVQPLYYGENDEWAAFASNRKSLWQLGIDSVVSFPPGSLCVLSKAGFQFKPIKTLTFTESKQFSIDEASKMLQKRLEYAVKERVAGCKEVDVAFSGGLDSSLIAYMVNKCGVKVNLVHVSLENEPEIEAAFEASEKLDLPLQVHLFKESDVEKTLPKVVDLIEEDSPVKAAIGVPIYWAAQKTQESGHTVLLAGQGADELFGGYQRYVNEYCISGDKVQQTMFEDVISLHQNNLERDEKICASFDVELRLPFCSFSLAEFASSLPINLKFEQNQNSLRKIVLRRSAADLGLPKSIVDKPKKAVQYSTGINNAIKRIAKKKNQTVNNYITGLFQESKQQYG